MLRNEASLFFVMLRNEASLFSVMLRNEASPQYIYLPKTHRDTERREKDLRLAPASKNK
jgi:hypothetical protein